MNFKSQPVYTEAHLDFYLFGRRSDNNNNNNNGVNNNITDNNSGGFNAYARTSFASLDEAMETLKAADPTLGVAFGSAPQAFHAYNGSNSFFDVSVSARFEAYATHYYLGHPFQQASPIPDIEPSLERTTLATVRDAYAGSASIYFDVSIGTSFDANATHYSFGSILRASLSNDTSASRSSPPRSGLPPPCIWTRLVTLHLKTSRLILKKHPTST